MKGSVVTGMMQHITRARPMLFGTPGRRLFGMLHAPAETSRPRAAVVLCSPFGQEAIRAHRTFKVLAERLARAGHAALRFDYCGTGDAEGDDWDVTFEGMQNDVEVAHATLCDHAEGRHAVWLGLGLGATAAWYAAARTSRPPHKLLLWDPIVDGNDYLAELRRRNASLMREVFSIPPPAAPPPAGMFEAIGFAVSDTFASQLQGLTVADIPELPPPIGAALVTSRPDPRHAALVERCRATGREIRSVEASHGINWMEENIDQGSLVPASALQGLLALAGEEA